MKSSLGAKPVSVSAGFNDFFTSQSNSSAIPSFAPTGSGSSAQASSGSEAGQQLLAANHMLAFRLFALAVATYTVKFMLGMIRYALDATLILLVLASIAAVAMPGPKDGPVAQALAYAESVVNPLFEIVADRGVDVASNCVENSQCGYFDNTGACVPGGWMNPQGNYTERGDLWRYFHGQCYISTRVEFVLLPAMVGLALLAAAIIAAWQYVPARWCGLGPSEDDTLSCTTSEAGSVYSESHHHHHHHHHRHHRHISEHMPLLIDNDPASRYATDGSRAHNTGGGWSYGPVPITRSMPGRPDGNAEGASLEEQYGSWNQRSGHMIQNPSNTKYYS
ncbi:hypothetical protein EV175_004385 [Coemansia sp. RSA 1933]|nr:hypothetical protein EV175_004385 [Coemansia sp. RSA 1933]